MAVYYIVLCQLLFINSYLALWRKCNSCCLQTHVTGSIWSHSCLVKYGSHFTIFILVAFSSELIVIFWFNPCVTNSESISVKCNLKKKSQTPINPTILIANIYNKFCYFFLKMQPLNSTNLNAYILCMYWMYCVGFKLSIE